MKIYWGRQNISELVGLPASVSKKNYKEAYRLAQSHSGYWAGLALFLLMSVLLFIAFEYFFPGENSLLRDLIRAACSIWPAEFIRYQFTVSVMRKHYQHILLRNPVVPGSLDEQAQRLIQEADNNERHQWRYLRRFTQPTLILLLLVLFSLLIRTVR